MNPQMEATNIARTGGAVALTFGFCTRNTVVLRRLEITGYEKLLESGSCFQIKMMLLSRRRLMRQFSGRNRKNWMEFYGRPSICMKMAELSHVILFFNKKFLQDLWFKLNYYVIC